jgi:hypothetical protein
MAFAKSYQQKHEYFHIRYLWFAVSGNNKKVSCLIGNNVYDYNTKLMVSVVGGIS